MTTDAQDKHVRHLEIQREMDEHAHFQGVDSAYEAWLYELEEDIEDEEQDY